MAEYIEREALLQDIEETVRFTAKTGTISPEMRGANKIIDRIKCAPAADAVTEDEIRKLRDELYENDEITFKGLAKINQFMVKHSSYKYDIYNTDEVSE